jgi:hypothetical protein
MDIGSWVTTTTKKSPFARSCGKDPEVAFIAEPNGYAVKADVAVGLVTGLFWGNEPVTGSDAPNIDASTADAASFLLCRGLCPGVDRPSFGARRAQFRSTI